MSTATIQIPGTQLDAVRESLNAIRHEVADGSGRSGGVGRLSDIDALLHQIDAAPDGVASRVTGPYAILWDAIYDALCVAAERFAADCNELWRGEADIDGARRQLAGLGERLALLDSLGTGPADVA